MKKENFSLLFVVAASLLLSLSHCPLFEIFFDDKEIFKYTGLVISRGGVPYRDFFDHKPPLIFFLNYFGELAGPWGFWMIDTMLVLGASVLFFNLCRRYKLRYPWTLPFLFNIMLRYSIVSLGIGQTREYTTIFLLIFFCLMMGHARYRYYMMGLLAALVLFMQQDQIVTLFPFVTYALFSNSRDENKKISARWIQFGSGGLLPGAIIIFYFYIHHALGDFWQDAFLFNTQWYLDKLPIARHLMVLKHKLNLSEFDYIFYSASILGISAVFLKHSNKFLLSVCLLGLLLSFSDEYLSAKLSFLDCFYYFLPLAATIPVLLFTVFAFSEESFLRQSAPQLIFTAMLSANLMLGSLRYITGLTTEESVIERTPEAVYLKTQTLRDHQYFAFGNGDYIYVYNRKKILSPTKWVYQHFYYWYPDWDKNFSIIRSITQSLDNYKTTYILDYSDARKITRPMKNQSILKYWKDYLKEKYEPVMLNGAPSLLWKRRDN